MSNPHLSVYLNDHLAGSTAGLEIIDQLRGVKDFEVWTTELGAEIKQDREELEALMRRAGISQSVMRQAAAWVTEKVAELKTRLDDAANGPLHRFELIEALALGIDGKRALWTALQTAAIQVPALASMDYPRLIQRAETQRQTVEVHRLLASAEALRDR